MATGGAQAIRDRLQPYAKLHHGEALLARVRQALCCTALAPYLYRNDLCGLTATAREGERSSAGLREGYTPVEPGVEHNPLYLKADGEFTELDCCDLPCQDPHATLGPLRKC
jgi:hypothetical protein